MLTLHETQFFFYLFFPFFSSLANKEGNQYRGAAVVQCQCPKGKTHYAH